MEEPTQTTGSSILQKEAEVLILPDGRTLSYSRFGSLSPSHYAFYFHSYPSSRLEGALQHEAALAQNIQLICPDRPGMGSSTYVAERQILDWPQDVLALADKLQISTFACLGVSGGGPYVVACYHKIPRSRLQAAAVVAGLWPTSLGTQGMLMELRAMLFLAPWVPGLVALGLDYGIGNLARDKAHPEAYAAAANKMFEARPGVDRAVWLDNVGGFQQNLLASMQEALKSDAKGAALEVKLFGSEWGFSLDDVKVQEDTLAIWHGGLDKNVPVSMAEKAATLMPGCILKVFPEEAHVSLSVRKANEVMAHLKDMMTGSSA